MYQGKITHEKLWNYLTKLAPYLEQREIETLTTFFEFLRQDYTPIQVFGDSTIQFSLLKEKIPYFQDDIPEFQIPNIENKNIQEMLKSFNEARTHMETD